MVALYIICGILLVLFILYVLSTKGRTGHHDLKNLRGWSYAHRGLHDDTVPENSMLGFRLARDAGYGVELDVHLLKDGNLAVFHDTALDRVTGRLGRIVDLTIEELTDYKLKNTDETIPEFTKVLELFDGKVPLIIELKSVNNYVSLCEKVCKALENYNGVYCVESFDPRCVHWFKRNRPEIVRGQLTENYFRSSGVKLPWVLKLSLKNQIFNFLNRPDFVAYRFSDRKTFSNFLCRRLWKMQGVSWTIQNKQDFDSAIKEGWVPIFEGFRP